MKIKSRESHPLQKKLLHDVLHELRTPLTILKGETGLSLKKERLRHEYKEVLASNLEEVNRISQIVENLSTLLKFEEHKLVLQKTSLNLDLLLRKTLANLKSLIKQKNIRIRMPSTKEIILNADENQFEILLTNLLASLIKLTPENGKLSFAVLKRNNNAVIQITGVAAGEFLNSDNDDLSVTVCKNIIKAHKGRTDIGKVTKQETTLSVFFPLTDL